MTEPRIDDQGRLEPSFVADEVGTLLGFLDYHRATFAWKTAGLTDAQLQATLHPTAMTLAGLTMHLSFVEEFWFTVTVADQPPAEPFASADWDADQDFEWHIAAEMSGAELQEHWRAAVERSRGVVRDALEAGGADPLAQRSPAWGGREELSLRWVLVHMIEEYARHNGHADLLREAIDGEVGD